MGRRLVGLLKSHPWFEIGALCASGARTGRSYREVVGGLWEDRDGAGPPDMPLLSGRPEEIDADVVFSALETGAAASAEPLFRKAGFPVVTNASPFRMDPEVPLVIPEINAGHLVLADLQRRRRGGFIAANPNCSTIGLCLALEPIRLAFGLERVDVTTLQALSGAGHPGIPSLDILDNVLPFIRNEEEKLEQEPNKIFGRAVRGRVRPASLELTAQCNRVPVREGHLLSVQVETLRLLSHRAAVKAFENYRSPLAGIGLPSAPERPVLLSEEEDRPQPLLDRGASAGMAVTVGRLRTHGHRCLRFVALVHNTVRGAAGGTLLLAELLASTGRLSQRRLPVKSRGARRVIRALDSGRSAP